MTVAEAQPLPIGPAEGVARRLVFEHVDWSFYEQTLRAIADGPQRVTYDSGRMEVEVPSQEHEQIKALIRRLVEAFAEERGIDLLAFASTTWKREDVDGGLEADESWYTGESARRMEGQQIDLATHPPPNLAVEVDLSPPSVRKEPIYARLGVAEVWRWRDGQLRCLLRGASGRYEEFSESRAMPGFPFELAGDLVHRHAGRRAGPAVKELRQWCQEG